MAEPTVDDLLALDLEYRLTIAARIGDDCDCPRYFISRRDVLMPEVLRMAAERDEDVADFFHAFARKVHARHATPSAQESR